MPYKPVPSQIDFNELEEQILQLWESHRIFEKSVSSRDSNKTFVFYEGPPTANGKPGIHHVLSRTMKDFICRLRTMQGFRVERKGGWDTHGLPVEIEVEKKLNINGKDKIFEFGIKEFNRLCKESVFEYKGLWDSLTTRMGYWVDLDHPYITCENNYIESVWWILNEFWKKGLIYQGDKILPYCPRCGTPLSSHEVSLGYKDVQDPSVYIKLKVRGEENTYFLVWTTTPWTLISNVALAVHPDVNYVKVQIENEKFILAEARLSILPGNKPYQVIERVKGSSLQNKEYERPFDFLKVDKKAFYVTLGEFVTTEDGSGIVHMAPAFGEDDYQMARKYDLPVLQPVDGAGKFTEDISPWKNQFVKDADSDIIKDLKARKILYRSEKVTHSYPFCWRCQTPLLYYARKSWYIKTTQYKEQLISNNANIHWIPEEVGSGRFGEWLKNNVDWSLSRDRFWGTPLPIWICENPKCNHQTSIGSVEELKKYSKTKINSSDLDLHKPFVDNILFKCEKCGGDMKRTPEVIDVWFDSGSMPYAQWHFPFEHKEEFLKNFPADFITEGIDQTRGWFYSLLAISTLLQQVRPDLFKDGRAYKTCISLELILDKNGQKMSKSKGNTVAPEEIIRKFGVDPLRWYFFVVSPTWATTRFNEDDIQEVIRKFFGTLVNTYSFFVLYANIDRFDNTKPLVPVSERSEIDRWILSALHSTTAAVTTSLDEYDLTKAARLIQTFLMDDVSNWYVRRSRRRFWKSGDEKDKLAAYQTLYEVLMKTAKMVAPFSPFLAEDIFQNLRTSSDEESIHLSEYPRSNPDRIDRELEFKMDISRHVVEITRSLRNDTQIKVRQPLSRIVVAVKNEKQKQAIELMDGIIREEINVKKIEVTLDANSLIIKKLKPNFKTLGPKFGKSVPFAAEAIKNMTGEDILKLEQKGKFEIFVDGHEKPIGLEEVEIITESQPGFAASSDGDLTLALDTALTEELIHEGFAREFVNRVQNMRKESDYHVTDRIQIFCEASPRLQNALQRQLDYIMQETLAIDVQFHLQNGGVHQEWDINNEPAKIMITRAQ